LSDIVNKEKAKFLSQMKYSGDNMFFKLFLKKDTGGIIANSLLLVKF